ncbi:MAG: hypothetical protein JRM80_11895 [Nitrososphaerota archaeon]|nr:hypothetical protein [Nitrososphaerota archaeon]
MDFRLPFAVGMVITLAGAFWDAWRHLNGLATSESLLNPFLNPAHGTIYAGAAVMAASLVLYKTGRLSLPITIGRRTYLAMLAGIALLLGGGLYDFWWHNAYGFADTTPWTPSHMTATAGFTILLVTGVLGLSRKSSVAVKAGLALSVALFVALWSAVLLMA